MSIIVFTCHRIGSHWTRRPRIAAPNSWTVLKLKAEVQRLDGGKHSEGGRKFAPPGTPEEALRRLWELGRMWINLSKQTVLLDSYNVVDRISEMEPGSPPNTSPA